MYNGTNFRSIPIGSLRLKDSLIRVWRNFYTENKTKISCIQNVSFKYENGNTCPLQSEIGATGLYIDIFLNDEKINYTISDDVAFLKVNYSIQNAAKKTVNKYDRTFWGIAFAFGRAYKTLSANVEIKLPENSSIINNGGLEQNFDNTLKYSQGLENIDKIVYGESFSITYDTNLFPPPSWWDNNKNWAISVILSIPIGLIGGFIVSNHFYKKKAK